MIIKDIFKDNIDRKINGVVKVGQSENSVIAQEVKEYVITSELKKHIRNFFNAYSDSFIHPTDDTGVWISGFFGSGKSHFLKMLSYLLKNETVDDRKVSEYFRDKLDDPAACIEIDNSTRHKTEVILFNIDAEGSMNKNNTAVLRVFAKMFYNNLGFYGENLKVAKLEQFIARKGKTEEFRRVFEENNGGSWIENRDTFEFCEDDIVETLISVMGMSEQSARDWFNGTEDIELSIAKLVSEIKEYVESQGKDFRLLFMIDEVGQYVGESKDLLLNLQSLVEEIGSKCGGKVWVICTGQEAIDDVIKSRMNEFSRIQARFKIRLSLSSASADEVIQKRILSKKDEYKPQLEKIYNENEPVFNNLFTFADCIQDIKGYKGADDFVKNFPFVPYQFIILSKVFTEIRKHGNTGKHLSGGERSMLSGFQEVAQKLKLRDEYTVAPFHLFYDTIHSFLDSSIKKVIDRAEKAAENQHGIEQCDVDVLKLLYLIRYIDDIKANVDNLVIMLADDIRIDKVKRRMEVQQSLDRLLGQNYIGKTTDVYNFLTDEEQDISRDIKNEHIDNSTVIDAIGNIVYDDIYTSKKFSYDTYNFSIDRYIDHVVHGTTGNNMCIDILTIAVDETEKNPMQLQLDSVGKVIAVLPETKYYECVQQSLKIKQYVKKRNISQLQQSAQNIIKGHQSEAEKLFAEAKEDLKKALIKAEFYVAGEKADIKGGDAKSRMDMAFNNLVGYVYTEIGKIDHHYSDDAEVRATALGKGQIALNGIENNAGAMTVVEEHLDMQFRRNISVSMFDVQSRYSQIPYGWKEIDIAGVVAELINKKKVVIKYAGETIQPDNSRLVDMLRKKSEIGKTSVAKRQSVSESNRKNTIAFLRDYYTAINVPADEDEVIKYAVARLEEDKAKYEGYKQQYTGRKYPEKQTVLEAISLINSVLSKKGDNTAFITSLLKAQEDLYDIKEDMEDVIHFFNNQVQIFDEAAALELRLREDANHIEGNKIAEEALNKIRRIVVANAENKKIYQEIPSLNSLMNTVKNEHECMLETRRAELRDIITQCRESLTEAADGKESAMGILSNAMKFYNEQGANINNCHGITLLDGFEKQLTKYHDEKYPIIKKMANPPKPVPKTQETKSPAPVTKKKNIKNIHRNIFFGTEQLESEADIDMYVEKLRRELKAQLKGFDGIKFN